jgi:serine protease Do
MRQIFEELTAAVGDLASSASPSVVSVGPAGSGFVFADGLVATNSHNLRGDLLVSFADGRTETSKVAGVDAEGDLAVLSVSTGDAPALQWADGPAKLGEAVVGISRPPGGGLRAGVGTVTGLDVAFRGPGGRLVRGAIEHSVPLAHGSSGGPLLDGGGHLVGLNTHRVGDGFYLALPAGTELRARLEALARGEEPSRVRLGVALAPSRVARRLRRAVGLPEREGALVQAVEQGSPAGRAGLRRGDLIISITPGSAPSRAVRSVEDLRNALDEAAESQPVGVVLGVVRGVEELSVAVDFAGGGASEEATA